MRLQLFPSIFIKQKLLNHRVEDRANAISSAWQRLCPCEFLHPKGLNKIYKKINFSLEVHFHECAD